MFIKLFLPSKNLGCLGLAIGEKFYIDYFTNPYKGIFIRWNNNRWNVHLRKLHIRKWL